MNPKSLLSLGPVKSSTFFSMIRETCSRTGTLLSLKAVVMKQPNVSAAITLSEKANSEFARDSTVLKHAVAERRDVASSPGTLSPPARSAGTFSGWRSRQTPGRWGVWGRACAEPAPGGGTGAPRCRGAPSLAARGRGSEEPEGSAGADSNNAPQEN